MVNMRYRLLSFLLLTLTALSSAAATGDAEREGGKLFRKAFGKDLEMEKRISLINRVARDYSKTRWGDDALWVLARVADMKKQSARAVVIRQQLLERKGSVEIQPFTRKQNLYNTSTIYQLKFLLERSGRIYSGTTGNTEKFDVVPLALHVELARGYETLQMPLPAVREYRRALDLVPGGFLEEQYRQRLMKLRKTYPKRTRKAFNDRKATETKGGSETAPTDNIGKKTFKRKTASRGQQNEKAPTSSGQDQADHH